MPGLMVNVDHVATVRQARGGEEPDPVVAAALAELAGCDGIIVHLREDRRHIQERDVELLRKTVRTKLNLEMAAVPEIVKIALKIVPDIVTLVPERRQELTTEGGLDVVGNRENLKRVVKELRNAGMMVSLFVDPQQEQIRASKEEVEADCIEIHTGTFSEAKHPLQQAKELEKIIAAVETASHLGLKINAGHGLNYHNIKKLIPVKGIEEFSIGHSIVARALMVGMERAVREMLHLIRE